MPNPKDGSVSADVVTAIKNAKAGQVRFRNDKAGIVHCTIGKVNFELDALKSNLSALLADLMKAKPAASKGHFVQKVSVSTTMGVGIVVDQASLGIVR
jgi:large subunit ribosomal protein L1